MSDFFQVDLGVLSKMTSTLQQAGEQMDQALQAFGSSEDGQVGPQTIVSAAKDFQSTWKYGLGQLQQAIQECTEGVDKVRQNYQETEQTVQQSLGKISSLLQE
ncbi:hypothetical protein [Actinospica robiniae]|uniref:hypothetical protein n=1 Tax=Actinospica robiniae TaxID=304901 RepID=UPI000425185E|nr:hypothetical protein [Actinospica robiniae]